MKSVCKAIDEPEGEAYQLADGCYSDVGRDQIDAVAISGRGGPQVDSRGKGSPNAARGGEDRRGRR